MTGVFHLFVFCYEGKILLTLFGDHIFPYGDWKKISVASWCLPKKVNFITIIKFSYNWIKCKLVPIWRTQGARFDLWSWVPTFGFLYMMWLRVPAPAKFWPRSRRDLGENLGENLGEFLAGEIAEIMVRSQNLGGQSWQGSKFIFGFGSTCVTRCKFLGALPKF